MISSIIDGVKDTQSEAGGPSLIKVHPDTAHPTLAWEKLQVKQTVATVKTLSRKTPIHPNKVRFVCVSDTHNRMPLQVDIPDGDILIHAGDFSMVGEPEEIVSFNEWLGKSNIENHQGRWVSILLTVTFHITKFALGSFHVDSPTTRGGGTCSGVGGHRSKRALDI